MNTSATGGFLAPRNDVVPLEDDALSNLLQELISGISGLPGNLVFPRWQPDPPTTPDYNITWAALGIVERRADLYPAIIHRSTGNGIDLLARQEELDVLVTFYGPQCGKYISQLREGLQIRQNTEILLLNELAIVEASDFTKAPEFVNQRWLDRIDMTITFRRQVRRNYDVENLLSAQGIVGDEEYQAQIDTTNLED